MPAKASVARISLNPAIPIRLWDGCPGMRRVHRHCSGVARAWGLVPASSRPKSSHSTFRIQVIARQIPSHAGDCSESTYVDSSALALPGTASTEPRTERAASGSTLEPLIMLRPICWSLRTSRSSGWGRSLSFAVAQKMRMLILQHLCAKSPPAQSREGHRAAPCALSGLATLSRSWLCAGGCGRAAHLHHRGERSTGHGKIGAGYRDARAGHGL